MRKKLVTKWVFILSVLLTPWAYADTTQQLEKQVCEDWSNAAGVIPDRTDLYTFRKGKYSYSGYMDGIYHFKFVLTDITADIHTRNLKDVVEKDVELALIKIPFTERLYYVRTSDLILFHN